MDSSFLAEFPDPLLQQQVRRAFQEWQLSSSSTSPTGSDRRDPLSPLTRRRLNVGAPSNFWDLRTVVLHELGHALGAQHPDAAWLNGTPPYRQNYGIDNQGNLVAQSPGGWEVMVEGSPLGSKGLREGEYHRFLSKDEFDLLDYGYGGHIEFVEVGTNFPANIVVRGFSNPMSTALGQAGPDSWQDRVPGDVSQGQLILTSDVAINATAGVATRKTTWTLSNTLDLPITKARIRMKGTDTFPIGFTSTGAHRFTKVPFIGVQGPREYENITRLFTDPVGGEIPPGDQVTFGFEMDVWDWTVSRAAVETTDGESHIVSLVTIVPLDFGLQSDSSDPLTLVGPVGQPEGLVTAPTRDIEHRGLRIVNTSETSVTVGAVAVAPLRGRGLHELDGTALDEAADADELITLEFPPEQLGPDEELIIILDGDEASLPAELSVLRHVTFDIGPLSEQPLLASAQITSSGLTAIVSVTALGDLVHDSRDFLCEQSPSVANCCVPGDDIVEGTNGFDLLIRNHGTVQGCALTHGGNDLVTIHGESSFIAAGSGSDVVKALAGRSRVMGQDGNDVLTIGGSAVVDGGNGNDIILAGHARGAFLGKNGSDYVLASSQNDKLEGSAGDDLLVGASGDDDIFPGSGVDVVEAGADNDVVTIRAVCEYGHQWLSGGSGIDTIVLPTTREEAEAAGLTIVEFEHVIENRVDQEGESDCA